MSQSRFLSLMNPNSSAAVRTMLMHTKLYSGGFGRQGGDSVRLDLLMVSPGKRFVLLVFA
jgi:hypothetical protein